MALSVALVLKALRLNLVPTRACPCICPLPGFVLPTVTDGWIRTRSLTLQVLEQPSQGWWLLLLMVLARGDTFATSTELQSEGDPSTKRYRS